MQVLQFEKNSEAWLEFKLGKAGGSDASKLLPKVQPPKDLTAEYVARLGLKTSEPTPTKSDPDKEKSLSVEAMLSQLTQAQLGVLKALQPKKDEFYRLIAERVARPITPNDYEDRLNGQKFSMMARGHILEPEAIALFEEKTGKKTDKGCVVWQRDDNPNSILSPDAPITTNGKATEAVEVKCPDSHVMIRAWHEKAYPEEYEEQALKYFVNNDDLETLYLTLYTDVIPALPILIFEIRRKDVKDDIEMYRAFEDEILRQADELAAKLAF